MKCWSTWSCTPHPRKGRKTAVTTTRGRGGTDAPRKLVLEFRETWDPRRRGEARAGDWRVRVVREQGIRGSIPPTVGDGWRLLLETLFARLRARGWDRQLLDVQDLHGGLRVSLAAATPAQ